MTEDHAFGELTAFAGKIDAASTIDANEIVAREAFERSGDSGRRNGEFFREARADRRLPFFEHFPNCFQIIFPRYAGLLPLHTSLCLLWICAGDWRAVRRGEALRQVHDSSLNFLENSLIRFGIRAEGIFDGPIFDFGEVFEYLFFRIATHVNDEIDFLPMRVENGFRSEAFGRDIIFGEGFKRWFGDVTERSKAAAGNFPQMRRELACDGFRHGAAAGVTQTNKKYAKVFAGLHLVKSFSQKDARSC